MDAIKKANTKAVCILTILFAFYHYMQGQIPPINDPNWELVCSKSDEFNEIFLDETKWIAFDKSDYPWGGGYCFCDEQVYLDDGILYLRVDKKEGYDPECKYHNVPYYSGGIQSVDHDYSYGYFEIMAKLPGAYINGRPNGKGFCSSFWTYYVEENDTCRLVHDEIDILEPSGIQYAEANKNVVGWHDEDPDCSIDHIKIGEFEYTYYQPLFIGYHKYAVEWLPDRIIYYFDDHPFYIEYDHPSMIMQPQYVVIDQQMQSQVSVNENMPFPQYMMVDYFHYYELKENCRRLLTILNNSQFENYPFGVLDRLVIGNGTSFLFLQNGDNFTLRASEETIINGDFTVPIGSELNIIPTPCDYANYTIRTEL